MNSPAISKNQPPLLGQNRGSFSLPGQLSLGHDGVVDSRRPYCVGVGTEQTNGCPKQRLAFLLHRPVPQILSLHVQVIEGLDNQILRPVPQFLSIRSGMLHIWQARRLHRAAERFEIPGGGTGQVRIGQGNRLERQIHSLLMQLVQGRKDDLRRPMLVRPVGRVIDPRRLQGCTHRAKAVAGSASQRRIGPVEAGTRRLRARMLFPPMGIELPDFPQDSFCWPDDGPELLYLCGIDAGGQQRFGVVAKVPIHRAKQRSGMAVQVAVGQFLAGVMALAQFGQHILFRPPARAAP